MRLSVKVIPKASRGEVLGWSGGHLRVAVTAPPERGKANAAVEQLLADVLQIRSARVRVVGGHRSRVKLLEIDGVDSAEVLRKLGA
jgi:uncharacterized protein (TIGR00251 family)